MTSDELYSACVKGMAQVVKQVRAQPGLTDRSLLKRANKRHVCLMYIHMACSQGLIVEKRSLFGNRYYPEGYGND